MTSPSEEELVAFYSSIARSHLPEVEGFIKRYPVNSAAMRGVLQLGLSFAALLYKPKMLEFLLESGAEIDGYDEDGDTALLAAIRMNKADSVFFLLEAGANPRQPGASGQMPLAAAQGKESFAIVKMLENKIATQPEMPVEDTPAAQALAAQRQNALRQKKPCSPFGKGGPKI